MLTDNIHNFVYSCFQIVVDDLVIIQILLFNFFTSSRETLEDLLLRQFILSFCFIAFAQTVFEHLKRGRKEEDRDRFGVKLLDLLHALIRI